jgi:hypothetical protein
VPQEGGTATTTTTAATAGRAASSGADDHLKGEPNDAQPRAIHDHHLGSS